MLQVYSPFALKYFNFFLLTTSRAHRAAEGGSMHTWPHQWSKPVLWLVHTPWCGWHTGVENGLATCTWDYTVPHFKFTL